MLILVDLDGTVRKTISGEVCPKNWRDQLLFPEAAQRLKVLSEKGYSIYGISNQGGCEAINPDTGKPYKSRGQAIAEMRFFLRMCPWVDRVYFCPNHTTLGKADDEIIRVCRPWWFPFLTVRREYNGMGDHPDWQTKQGFRKPNTGMIELAYKQFADEDRSCWPHKIVKPESVLFIGDRDSDKEAAERYGCQFQWADDWHKEGLT